MQFTLRPTKQRVNMVIKDHVIRYSFNDQSELNGVKSYGERYLPEGVLQEGKIVDPFQFSSVIEELVDTYEWKRKKLYFCVPDTSVVIRPYKIPADLGDDEVKGYLYMKLGEDLHLPFENPIFDYHRMDQEKSHVNILLFAYPEERVRAFQETFEEVGLKPRAADLSSLSLYRLYHSLDLARPDDHLLSLQWNTDACVLTVFHQMQPAFTRHMKSPLAIKDFHEHEGTGEHFWAGDQGDLDAYIHDQLMEIERIMNFYRFSVTQDKASISKILLSGDFPHMEDVYDQLKAQFNLPIERVNLPHVYTKDGDTIPATFAEVIGLALKQ